jgi:hypothetical protein
MSPMLSAGILVGIGRLIVTVSKSATNRMPLRSMPLSGLSFRGTPLS